MFIQEVIAAVKSGESFVTLVDFDGEVIVEHNGKEVFLKMQNMNVPHRKILNDAFNGNLKIED
ncbi:hypothetical protein [Vibrio cincinnatiensis]